MRTVFIIHGSYGNPDENWFPWLKSELEHLGCRVIVPQFQTPPDEDPKYGGHKLHMWFEKFNEYKEFIGEDTILVGHSRGCIFIYRILEKLQKPIYASFLVGPWLTRWTTPVNWKHVDSFHEDKFHWDHMKKMCNHIEVYQSTNDEIPVEEGKIIAEKLDATIHIVENGGHFNVARDPSYVTFPLLLENIKKQI